MKYAPGCTEFDMERARVEAWHATYNAALQGLCAGCGSFVGLDWIMDRAKLAADRAHGELK